MYVNVQLDVVRENSSLKRWIVISFLNNTSSSFTRARWRRLSSFRRVARRLITDNTYLTPTVRPSEEPVSGRKLSRIRRSFPSIHESSKRFTEFSVIALKNKSRNKPASFTQVVRCWNSTGGQHVMQQCCIMYTALLFECSVNNIDIDLIIMFITQLIVKLLQRKFKTWASATFFWSE